MEDVRFNVCAHTHSIRERKRDEIAEKGNQRAGARKKERKGRKRREKDERRTGEGRDEVSVVKSTVAAPAKNSN